MIVEFGCARSICITANVGLIFHLFLWLSNSQIQFLSTSHVDGHDLQIVSHRHFTLNSCQWFLMTSNDVSQIGFYRWDIVHKHAPQPDSINPNGQVTRVHQKHSRMYVFCTFLIPTYCFILLLLLLSLTKQNVISKVRRLMHNIILHKPQL